MVRTKRTESHLLSLDTHLEIFLANKHNYDLQSKCVLFWTFISKPEWVSSSMLPPSTYFALILNRHTETEYRLRKGHPFEILSDCNAESKSTTKSFYLVGKYSEHCPLEQVLTGRAVSHPLEFPKLPTHRAHVCSKRIRRWDEYSFLRLTVPHHNRS